MIGVVARIVLAGVLAAAAVAKLRDGAAARTMLADVGVPGLLIGPVAAGLPLVEFALACGLLLTDTARAGAVATGALMLAFTAVLTVVLARGRAVDCHCFGELGARPVDRSTLARNVALVALAAVAAIRPGGAIGERIAQLDANTAAELSEALVIVTLAGVCMRVLGRHGRTLLELDLLTRTTDRPAIPEPTGLAVGSEAPRWSLGRLDAGPTTLTALLEHRQPLLLVFTSPGCGPCSALIAELASWQERLGDQLTITVIVRGDATQLAEYAEHNLSDVALDVTGDTGRAYRVNGFPTAVLIATDGRVAAPAALGRDAIARLTAITTRGEILAPT